MRFLLNHHARRSVAIKSTMNTNKSVKVSATASKSPDDTENNIVNTNHNLTKSWGQQCSPNCGCVLRFETKIDERQRIVDCNYVAKSVVTTIDKENGGRLTPVYTTRMSKPMFQECKCKSLHVLAKNVTSYLPNKRWDHVQSMNDFAFMRSSIAFRHAVLSEHDLPRTDTHCFDVVEEAFTGMFNGNVPSKRRINAPFEKVFAAECLQRPLEVHYCKTKRNYQEDTLQMPRPRELRTENSSDSDHRRLGVDRNRTMSTPKTIAALGMFDINAENWLDEDEYDNGETAVHSKNDKFDWVSYVDELHMVNDSA
jgi:hypothetical protein